MITLQKRKKIIKIKGVSGNLGLSLSCPSPSPPVSKAPEEETHQPRKRIVATTRTGLNIYQKRSVFAVEHPRCVFCFLNEK
jgi:hypothetical protein